MGKLLMGQSDKNQCLDMFSPDNSSDGNLKKKWKIINGKRCLIKSGNSLNNQEPFNEVIATNLYERILLKNEYVPYTILEEEGIYYSCCETMINVNEELVPAYYIDKTQKLRGHDSLYEHYLKACENFCIPDTKVMVDKMIVCDYLIANFDRHYRNFGAIRNIETLEWERIAPIFDSGSSLWATTPTRSISSTYKSKPFKANPKDQLTLVQNLDWLSAENLIGFEEDIKDILRINPYMDEERILCISNQVEKRISHVLDRKKDLKKLNK